MSDLDFKSLTLHELSGITATSNNELPKHHEFYVEDFVTLKISEILGFEEQHTFLQAILESNITPARFNLLSRIRLAASCRIVKLLRQAYSEIASRGDGPNEEEAKELGWEKALALCRIREKLSALHATKTSASSKGDGESEVPGYQELAKEVSEMVGSEACLDKPNFETVPSPALSRTTTYGGSRHAVFYLDGPDLLILKIHQVQGVLFRIPARRVEGAKVINDLIAATPRGHPVSTDDNPLEIGGEALTIHGFESFLRITYASHSNEIAAKLNFNEWAQGLRVATLLKYETADNYIIDVLQTSFKGQDPIDLIELANECNVERWLPTQYARLATRTEVITEVEMRRLGYKSASEIASRREAEALRRGKQQSKTGAVEEFKQREVSQGQSVTKFKR
ncbi:hypothetical protein FRC00_004389 [Tulasnella sp. 408]|nr:hypothetical protein FRC00_004389 [Tulasnella sp. 408]